MDDGDHETFGFCQKEKTSNATLTINTKKLPRVWNEELPLEVCFSIWADPEQVNARYAETFKVGRFGVLGSSN